MVCSPKDLARATTRVPSRYARSDSAYGSRFVFGGEHLDPRTFSRANGSAADNPHTGKIEAQALTLDSTRGATDEVTLRTDCEHGPRTADPTVGVRALLALPKSRRPAPQPQTQPEQELLPVRAVRYIRWLVEVRRIPIPPGRKRQGWHHLAAERIRPARRRRASAQPRRATARRLSGASTTYEATTN